eukprot:g28218.t1
MCLSANLRCNTESLEAAKRHSMESPQEKGTETLNASVISLLLPQAGAFCFREDAGIGELECFEKDAALGGRPEFVRHRYHWHHSEYRRYLEDYAKKFGLERHISFNMTVASVEGGPGRWHVVTQDAAGHLLDRGIYDAVAVCSGAHQAINKPTLPGLESFKGEASGKDRGVVCFMAVCMPCVVVGLGESGADIVREISEVASSTVLALRSYPYLIPRLARPFHSNPLGCSSDAFTSHLRHDYLLVPMRHYRRLKDFLNRLMCTLAALLFFFFPFLGTGQS